MSLTGNIRKYRSSFHVLLVDSEFTGKIKSIIQTSDYNLTRTTKAQLFIHLPKDPPHVLMMSIENEDIGFWKKKIEQVKLLSPETHIVGLGCRSSLKQHAGTLGEYFDDFIQIPLLAPDFVVQALDRLCQQDYFRYLNEQLSERNTATEESEGESYQKFVLLDVWFNQLQHKNSVENSINFFLKEASQSMMGTPIVFLKYYLTYHNLLPVQSCGVDLSVCKGYGMDLKKEMKGRNLEFFKSNPREKYINHFVKEVFSFENYSLRSLFVDDEFKGVFIFLGDKDEAVTEPYVKLCFKSLTNHLSRLQWQDRFHKVNHLDEVTGALNAHFFKEKITEELHRSRRTQVPFSFVNFRIDNMNSLTLEEGVDSIKVLKKLMVEIIKKNIRFNDSIGVLGSNEIALLLPFTAKKQACVVADRYRQIIESADFARIFRSKPKVTVSVGVSEYPSHGHDIEDIIRRADDSLDQLMKNNENNKVCLALTPSGFAPDFVFQPEAELRT